MFLTVKQNTIPDFLSALGFIAPKGLDMQYIISPNTISKDAVDTLGEAGFNEAPVVNDVKDYSVKYLKKDPKLSHSFSTRSPLTSDPELMSDEFPRQIDPVEPELFEPGEIKNPHRAIQIAECENINGKAYMLKENFCGMPRNTLFAFAKDGN